MEFVRRHLSYSNIAATLALVFAMSGGAVAATHYLINSTKQINPKVLNALRAGTGTDGAKGTNGASGANGSSGPSGAQGAQGNPGPAGPTGNTGATGATGERGEPGPVGGSVDPWTPITEHPNLVEPKAHKEFEPLGVRTESGGKTARLRGVLEVETEVKSSSEPLFMIPEGDRPSRSVEFGIDVSSASGANHAGSLKISASGVVTDPEAPIPPGNWYLLDGITWNLN
jgi:Collagen triple helix repeat (20 copies)